MGRLMQGCTVAYKVWGNHKDMINVLGFGNGQMGEVGVGEMLAGGVEMGEDEGEAGESGVGEGGGGGGEEGWDGGRDMEPCHK